jgi:hypothetical protein
MQQVTCVVIFDICKANCPKLEMEDHGVELDMSSLRLYGVEGGV